MSRVSLLVMCGGIAMLSALLADASPSHLSDSSAALGEPVYSVSVPKFAPAWRRYHAKNGTPIVVNLRQEYVTSHRWGWDTYLAERTHFRSQNGDFLDGAFSSELSIPSPPQGNNLTLRGYFDGYEQCRRACEKLESSNGGRASQN